MSCRVPSLRALILLLCPVLAGCGGLTAQEAQEFPILQEFRIVNWNVAGYDPGHWFPGKDLAVALRVLEKVDRIDANVITLQEATDETFQLVEQFLGPEWSCHTWSPGIDELVTCVKGEATGFRGETLSGTAGLPPEERWWGYTQLEYRGVTITNVHTRAGAVERHLEELHAAVVSGILAGDFNHESPEHPGWHQTDPDIDHEPTLHGWETRIDHVLSVERPVISWGYVLDEEPPFENISNHRVLLTGVRLPLPGP
jgi:hypothetical protein